MLYNLEGHNPNVKVGLYRDKPRRCVHVLYPWNDSNSINLDPKMVY